MEKKNNKGVKINYTAQKFVNVGIRLFMLAFNNVSERTSITRERKKPMEMKISSIR